MNFITSHINYVLIAGGLLGLFLGGEALIRGAVALAERLKIPKLIIGLTIIGFGTSMPELLVALQSVQLGAPDVAMGNVVGSNIANILLILGLGALLRPMATTARNLKREALIMLIVSAGLIWLAWTSMISQRTGLIMTGILLAYLLLVYVLEGRKGNDDFVPETRLSPWVALLWIIAGLTALITGADCLVRGATAVARDFGVSDAVIGLTLVAVGTSLPELTVTILSSIRRQNEVALGNVLGSNIFNILGILGITAAVQPLPIASHFLHFDLPLMFAAAVCLTLLILRGKPIGRLTGLLLLLIYAGYTVWLVRGPALLDILR
jgi:cation:H+ antiporter